MPRSHCGIADLEIKEPAWGIVRQQLSKPSVFRTRLSGELSRLRAKSVDALEHKRTDSALDDQSYQLLGRVIASRTLACRRSVHDPDHSVPHYESMFEDALVDRPELLDRQIPGVDVFGRAAIAEFHVGHAEY